MTDTVVLLDDREWQGFLRDMKKKLQDPFALLKVGAMTYGFKDIIDHFSKEEGPEGKWPKRKESTQKAYAIMGKRHAKYNPSNRLLQLTGNLRKSLLPTSGNTKQQGRYGILLFTNVPYAGRHNYGEGKTPKREFMFLSGPAQQQMVDLILSRVVGE